MLLYRAYAASIETQDTKAYFMKKILLLLLIPIFSLAHPHVFIDTKLILATKKNKIEKLHITWQFDDMNSQIMMMDYDGNRDKKFSRKESQRLRKAYFDTLSTKNYFTHIKVDGKEIKLSNSIRNFAVSIKSNLLVISFTLDFKNIQQRKSVNIGFWDEVNYNAFSIEEGNVKFSGKALRTKLDFYESDLFVTDLLKVAL